MSGEWADEQVRRALEALDELAEAHDMEAYSIARGLFMALGHRLGVLHEAAGLLGFAVSISDLGDIHAVPLQRGGLN